MNGGQHKIVGAGMGIGLFLVMNRLGYQVEGGLAAVAAVGGSMIPDIDHDRTKLGRKRKIVTSITSKAVMIALYAGIAISAVLLFLIFKQGMDFGINPMLLVGGIGGIVLILFLQRIISKSDTYKWAAKHRGLMHTLMPLIPLVFVITSTPAPIIRYSMIGVVAGYLSHLIADMFTVAGCPILFPVTRVNIRIMRFKSEDGTLNVVAIVLAALFSVAGYYLPNIFNI